MITIERTPEYMAELENRLKSAAQGKDLKVIRQNVDKLYDEVAQSVKPGQVDSALDMVSQVRERVIQAQRVKRLSEHPKVERRPKQYTADELR